MSAFTHPETTAIAEAQRQAASQAATPPTAHSTNEWLTFGLGEEEYGIDILRVQEIRCYEKPTRIANAPDYVKGIVNLRGVIVPILDLRMRFELADARYDASTVTIVLNLGGRTVGVVVDSVSDVLELKDDEVKPLPEMPTSVESRFITGIGSLRHDDVDRTLILLDIAALVESVKVRSLGNDAVLA